MKNNENITCAVIEDLLPVYTEGLCNDETKALIEAHLAECEACAALAKQVPIPEQKDIPVPTEKKAFKKVARKIRKSRILNTILGGIITVAVLVLCVLSYGQISYDHGIPSFDSVRFSIQTKRLTKMLLNGEYESYLNHIDNWSSLSALDNNASFGGQENIDAFRKQYSDEFVKRYQAAYGNTKAKSVRTHDIGHYPMVDFSDELCGAVEVTFEDGRSMELFYIAKELGWYSCWIGGWSDWGETDDSAEGAFAQCMDFGYDLHTNAKVMRAHMLVREGELKDAASHTACFMFRDDLRETVNERVKQFYLHEDFAVTDCIYSELRWDTEKQMLYFIATIHAKDSEGSAVMQTRIYDSYDGWLIPEQSDASVWEQGCTPALAEALLHFFG